MTTHEAIIQEINRQFMDSLGDWTGDAIWQQTGGGFAGGVAALLLQHNEDTKAMSLDYPFIQPRERHTHRLFGAAGVYPYGKTITLTWTLTDGIYTFTDQLHIIGALNPAVIDFNIDLPNDFKKDSAQLLFTAHEDIPADNDGLFIDSISLTYETKIDYLPFIGIG
jgi:hypothetical protein